MTGKSILLRHDYFNIHLTKQYLGMTHDNIKDGIRQFLHESILQDENIAIENDTPLISGGIMDSISTLKMVDFLEKKFSIEFQPHEVDQENLNTIDLIAQFVLSKM